MALRKIVLGLVLLAVVWGGIAPARAAGDRLPFDQRGSRLTLELRVYPPPPDRLCPGEVHTMSVTVVGTLTRPGQEPLTAAVTGARITAAVSNAGVVQAHPIRATTAEDLPFFAPDALFEVVTLEEGTASVTFRVRPARSFTLTPTLSPPVLVRTPRNISARSQPVVFNVEECVVKVWGTHHGYSNQPYLTSVTIGHLQEVELEHRLGTYSGTTDFLLNYHGTVSGPAASCTWSVTGLVYPVSMNARLERRTAIRLIIHFGAGPPTIPINCTHAGAAEGETPVLSFWNQTLRIPAAGGGRYHIDDVPGTPGFIDSLTLFAQLYFKD